LKSVPSLVLEEKGMQLTCKSGAFVVSVAQNTHFYRLKYEVKPMKLKN